MDRQTFIRSCGMGLCCTGIGLFAGDGQTNTKTATPPPSLETPLGEKYDFTQTWLKRFFDVLDENLDEETRKKIMLENGRRCHLQSSNGQKPPKPIAVDVLVNALQASVGKENCYLEGNNIFFNYVSNPKGLKISDGFCLCPMVEKGPAELSGTYCYCSVGYVKGMFEDIIAKPVKVELLESLKRGGKSCKFKITVA